MLRSLLLLSAVLPSASQSQAIYRNQTFDYTYSNAKFGYTLSFPAVWSPSGNAYSNAFEIRNYDRQAPDSVPEKNRASVIVVDTINENTAATLSFLNGLDALPATSIDHLRIDEHRAVRVVNRMPAQPIAPGTARSQPHGSEDGDTKLYLSIDLYIANGKHLISIAARVPVEADTTVVADIRRIQDSVRFRARGTR